MYVMLSHRSVFTSRIGKHRGSVADPEHLFDVFRPLLVSVRVERMQESDVLLRPKRIAELLDFRDMTTARSTEQP